MVKNNTGGNKSKGMARKNVGKQDHSLRVASEQEEVYAQAVKVLGGKIVSVIDLDGNPMQAHIRGRFKRAKRDNFIGANTWLLVGLWPQQGGIKQCDILEVYSDAEKTKLKNSVTNVNWSLFIANDAKTFTDKMATTNDDLGGGIKFTHEDNDELERMIAAQAEGGGVFDDSEEQVNVDDI